MTATERLEKQLDEKDERIEEEKRLGPRLTAALDKYIDGNNRSRERFLATATPDMIETYKAALKEMGIEE